MQLNVSQKSDLISTYFNLRFCLLYLFNNNPEIFVIQSGVIYNGTPKTVRLNTYRFIKTMKIR